MTGVQKQKAGKHVTHSKKSRGNPVGLLLIVLIIMGTALLYTRKPVPQQQSTIPEISSENELSKETVTPVPEDSMTEQKEENDCSEQLSSEACENDFELGLPSITEQSYYRATNLEKKDLEIEKSSFSENVHYKYNGITLFPEDYADWPELGVFAINSDAVFNAVGKNLDFIIGLDGMGFGNWSDGFKSLLFGDTYIESWESVRNRAQQLNRFIKTNTTEEEIIHALETISSSGGTFDYNNTAFSFVIADTKQAAKELGISEEMLGYTLAALTMYPVTISFSGYSVSIEHVK